MTTVAKHLTNNINKCEANKTQTNRMSRFIK